MFLLHLVDLLDRQVHLDFHHDGLLLLHRLVRERLDPRTLPPEPQLIPIPMSGGDDDEPPHKESQRERPRSRDRVHPQAQLPQVPQFNFWSLQILMLY